VRFKTIEHTADIGIEVEADTLEELFEGAALGMLSIIVDPSRDIGRGIEAEVSLEAGDIEGLLFEWLNELIFMMDARGVLLSEFQVDGINEVHLEATVRGEKIRQGGNRLMTEVKAATFHQLLVEKRGTWFARVILDV